jgi:hypothetical protein
MGIPGVLKRLFGQFVSGEMVSFSVSGCGGTVGVGRKVMKFRDSIVRALWHVVLLRDWMRLRGGTALVCSPWMVGGTLSK